MSVFSIVTGASVILRENGVYKQCEVATYNGRVFGKLGSGFVLLHAESFGVHGTSKPKVTWENLVGVTACTKPFDTSIYVKE